MYLIEIINRNTIIFNDLSSLLCLKYQFKHINNIIVIFIKEELIKMCLLLMEAQIKLLKY